jgi:hypothetical protein
MDPNANRSRGRSPRADPYWQRRFFTLIAGLGVVGLLAWACSGVASGGNSASSSGRPSSAAYSSTSATPTSPAPSSPSPSASPSRSLSLPATPKTSPSPSASSRAAQAKPAQKAAAGPVACPAADLVLTLTASQTSYGSAATPAFQVDIVSTDAATCTLDTGPAALRLVVLHGSSVAYNSATCLHGARKHVVSLHRGVPVVTSMAWNKHETAPGCPTTVLAATNRTYVAVAQAGGAQSPQSSFRLTGTPATAKAATPAARSTARSR